MRLVAVKHIASVAGKLTMEGKALRCTAVTDGDVVGTVGNSVGVTAQ